MALSLLALCLNFTVSCAGKSKLQKTASNTPFQTPIDTFETWRRAALEMNVPLMLSTYAAAGRQTVEGDILNASKDELSAMQAEAKQTEFKIEKLVYEGDRAFLRVKRIFRGKDEVEILTFVREGQDWKIIP